MLGLDSTIETTVTTEPITDETQMIIDVPIIEHLDVPIADPVPTKARRGRPPKAKPIQTEQDLPLRGRPALAEKALIYENTRKSSRNKWKGNIDFKLNFN